MKKYLLPLFLLLSVQLSFTQSYKGSTDSSFAAKDGSILMPFNRSVLSAGKVITYGNPELENHALDICILPDQQNLVVEDRYGIAILDAASQELKYRWAFGEQRDFKSFMNTYSGIKSFVYQDTTYIVWSATGDKDKGYILIAQWDGTAIKNVNTIQLLKVSPAANSIPNEIAVRSEAGIPYLYVVLNGNDQLVKINFITRETVWTSKTGVAPFGLRIIGQKAYVTNWAGPQVTDSSLENAGTPWGHAYTNPATGATATGSLCIFDITTGKKLQELKLGLHPNAVISSPDERFIYIANGSSDFVSVVNVNEEKVIDSIDVGLFSRRYKYFGSSPNALAINATGTSIYVANGFDNAIAVVSLGSKQATKGEGNGFIKGYIPTEAYPSGIALLKGKLFVTNLEAKGSRVLSGAKELKQPDGSVIEAYSIHKELASVSVISLPEQAVLAGYTESVKKMNLFYRISLTNQAPRKNIAAQPLPERIGEPSVFKHVIYIIKENKTYDQVYGDLKQGRGDARLCIFGDSVTPNQHQLAGTFGLLDNYDASGKSSAEGHQWTDAAMVSDYIEKSVRAWFRSYPHRQADALVYNKNGFIWNNALDHGKTVRIFGEACTTAFDTKMKWLDIYTNYVNGQPMAFKNSTTIARLRPYISPAYPDCDNFIFTDQIRASIFIDELKQFEQKSGDSLPNLIVLSLPNDHTSGMSPNFPIPKAMVADNDLALGRIIEAVTKSRFWDSTVVFVTEDDSQGGWDHISSYRTTGLVISPFSNFNTTIHTHYNQTSMVRTIEQILGLPPMNTLDATALPMFDCFSNTKTPYVYQAVSNKIPLNTMNKPFAALQGKALYFAKLSANTAFKEIDGGDDADMNKILWFDAKGAMPYPEVTRK